MNPRYRKFLIAGIGAVLIVANEFFAADIGIADIEGIVTAGLAVLSAIGVRQIPNSGV